jgi:hypothetical protein
MIQNRQQLLDQLPPQIQGMIESMADKSKPIFLRDNCAAMLEVVVKACQEELFKFDKERMKANIESRTAKKKK